MASQEQVKNIVKQIKDERVNSEDRLKEDGQKYLMYNGQLDKIVKEIIFSEFKNPKMIKELQNRIVPINIIKKMIDRLAKVYKNGALRSPVVMDDNDQELIDRYSEAFQINKTMSFCNQMTKLTKHSLLELYLDMDSVPRVRVLPSHTFFVYSDNYINPEDMTSVIKIVRDGFDMEETDKRYSYWDAENHYIIDGAGAIKWAEMAQFGNEEGINPFGEIPFVHVSQQFELLYPIRSNDITRIQTAICLLLSDTTVAQKYLSWATLLLTGVEGEANIEVGPAAILSLPPGVDGTVPDAKYLQPDLKPESVLQVVEALIQMVLSTNNLSSATVSGKVQANSTASGVSKMLDQMESTEDISEQRQIYSNAEMELWYKFAHYMLPYWVQSGLVAPNYAGAFSPEFELSIKYPDIKPMLTKREMIDNAKAELDAGFTSLKRAIKSVNPDLDDAEVDDLIAEIQKEKAERVSFFERNMRGKADSGETEG